MTMSFQEPTGVPFWVLLVDFESILVVVWVHVGLGVGQGYEAHECIEDRLGPGTEVVEECKDGICWHQGEGRFAGEGVVRWQTSRVTGQDNRRPRSEVGEGLSFQHTSSPAPLTRAHRSIPGE